MFLLNEKVAVITGATGALGTAIAKTLHKQGATVAITGTNSEKLSDLAAELLNERVYTFVCDLSQNAAELIPNVEKNCGKVDILINNAGINRDQLALRMSDDSWDDVLNVNLKIPFQLSRAVLRGMLRRQSGRIINISSIVGFIGNSGQSNYCASKAGMVGMTKAMAREIAMKGITVNCVAPGFIESKMTDVLPIAVREKMLDSIPMGKMGSSQDVANAVVFLAADESMYITGQTIHVNGGMAMV